jgi:hypothetical protein
MALLFQRIKTSFSRLGMAYSDGLATARWKEGSRLLLRVSMLGFLVMVALLKWTLLPPFSKSIQPTSAPSFGESISGKVSLPIQAHLKAAVLPDELKKWMSSAAMEKQNKVHKEEPPLLPPSVSAKYPDGIVAKSSVSAQPFLVAKYASYFPSTATPTSSYWYWLKPSLIVAELIPFIFFLWTGLRSDQIRYRQRDWVMHLMGANPAQVRRLLYYRTGLIGVSAACLGCLCFLGLSNYIHDIPRLSMRTNVGIILSIWILSLGLSLVAGYFPPAANADPML